MATVKKIEALELTLTDEEAKFLEGLLVAAVEFDRYPVAEGIYGAISTLTDTDTPDFVLDGDFFVKVEDKTDE